jgi:hypothetical protein
MDLAVVLPCALFLANLCLGWLIGGAILIHFLIRESFAGDDDGPPDRMKDCER